MKTLERLRQMKKKATDRMAQLNELARAETRELSAAEKLEYDSLKANAEELAASITQLETEQQESAPIAGLAAVVAPLVPGTLTAQPDAETLRQQAITDERLRVSTIAERIAASGLPAETMTALTA